MSKRKSLLIGVALAAAAMSIWVLSRHLRADEVVNTTLCTVTAAPGSFDGHLIRIAAQLKSDGREHSMLFDQTCSQTGIVLVDGTPGGANFRALSEAVYIGRPGTFDKKITGTFVGHFEWHPKRLPERTIALTGVYDLLTKPLSR